MRLPAPPGEHPLAGQPNPILDGDFLVVARSALILISDSMTMATTEAPMTSPGNVTARILPYVFLTFTCYLAIGVQLAILPSYVHLNLGSAPFLPASSSAWNTWDSADASQAGRMVDRLGAKRTVRYGLITCAVSGAFTVAAAISVHIPWLSLSLLVAEGCSLARAKA